jgi:hypothetical protein
MSPARARLLALPFVLLAMGLCLFVEFWVEPRVASLPLLLCALGGSIAAPLLGYRLLTRRALRRPAFWIDEQRMLAPASPRWLANYSMSLAWACAGNLPKEHVGGGTAWRLAYESTHDRMVMALLTLGVVFAFWPLLADRPQLSLGPDGITVRNLVSGYRIGWDEIESVSPRTPNMPVRLVDRRRPRRLPTASLHIDPVFLAAEIRRRGGFA